MKLFRPLSLCIALRYIRAKRRNHFISFISFSSVLGIALGVAVLITVMAVMNGFDEEITHQIFGVVQHMTISSLNGHVADWQKLQRKVLRHPEIKGAAPYVSGQGLLSYSGLVRPSYLSGILPNEESRVSEVAQRMSSGRLDALKAGQFGIVLGEDLARSLGVRVGDKVAVMIPQVNVSILGVTPRFRPFTVVGVFKMGGGFRFDNTLAFIHLRDAQKLFTLGNDVSGLRLKINDLFAAPRLSYELANKLPMHYVVGNWTQQFGEFFRTIKLEKNMMFLILMLIIAIAAFNLVSSLVMVVTDKRADIAILRTLGATPRMILSVFILQGALLGLIGTMVGVIGGVLLAWNVTEVVSGIQALLNTQLISANVYFIDYLPSKIVCSDVVQIGSMAFAMSLIATLYPAWRAAKTQPAEALRYE